MRPKPLLSLLESVNTQTRYPDSIIIVDGSTNNDTRKALESVDFKRLVYYQVEDVHRGLTKQRNFGISKVATDIDVVCFLDDDIVLTPTYFSTLLETYDQFPEALGVGGYIINDVNWQQLKKSQTIATNQFAYDCWVRKDGNRFVLRKKLGLDTDRPPGFMPTFAHGRSVSFLPPSGKIYKVEQFMGGVSSYKRRVLEEQKFSEYFEGYGLYEDADYTLRLSKKGELYVHTGAQLYHYHEDSGRPNRYSYGKMVVRNGWYVWRIRFPNPSLKARFKWNAVSFLLTLIRLSNAITGSKKREALTETAGRFVGWLSVLVNPPKRK